MTLRDVGVLGAALALAVSLSAPTASTWASWTKASSVSAVSTALAVRPITLTCSPGPGSTASTVTISWTGQQVGGVYLTPTATVGGTAVVVNGASTATPSITLSSTTYAPGLLGSRDYAVQVTARVPNTATWSATAARTVRASRLTILSDIGCRP